MRTVLQRGIDPFKRESSRLALGRPGASNSAYARRRVKARPFGAMLG